MIALTAATVARMSFDELLEAGICDCGQRLEGHPDLPPARPWGEGRPCSVNARYAAQAEISRRHEREAR